MRIVDRDRVAAVRAAMPGETNVDELADVFALLSDPGRLRILTALLEGEMCVCDLAASTALSESAVSHAMRLLRAHRVVRVRRSGRMAYYRLDDAHVRMLLDLALTHTRHASPVHVEHGDSEEGGGGHRSESSGGPNGESVDEQGRPGPVRSGERGD